MVWKSIIFTFCLIKSWSHDQSECTNIFHSQQKEVLNQQRFQIFILSGDLKSTAADRNSITIFYINAINAH